MKTLEASLRLAVPVDALVVSADWTEALSKITRATVVLASAEPLPVEELLNSEARLELCDHLDRERAIQLIVIAGQHVASDSSSHRTELALASPMARLEHTADTRKFLHKAPHVLVKEILGEHAIEHKLRLGEPPQERSYSVQYRESDFAFVARLLADEGISFRCEDDGSVTLLDSPNHTAAIEDDPLLELTDDPGVSTERDSLSSLASTREVRAGALSVHEFNWKQSRTVSADAVSPSDADIEVYLPFCGRFDDESAATFARRQLEARRFGSAIFRGTANALMLRPDRSLRVASPLEGELPLAIVEIWHRYRNERTNAAMGASYENECVAHGPRETFRPAPIVRALVSGAVSAIARGPEGAQVHTDEFGRFKANFAWDEDPKENDQDSPWLRQLQEVGSGMQIPRVGWEISVLHAEGDPDRPIGVARLINALDPPSQDLPLHQHRLALRTGFPASRTQFNEVMLDDSIGAMKFEVRAQRNMELIVRENSRESVGANSAVTVGGNRSHQVGASRQTQVGGDALFATHGSATLAVAGNQGLAVGGNAAVAAGESLHVAIGGQDAEMIGGDCVQVATDMDIASRVWQESIGTELTTDAAENLTCEIGSELLLLVSGDHAQKISGNVAKSAAGALTQRIGTDVTMCSASTLACQSAKRVISVRKTATLDAKSLILLGSDAITLSSDKLVSLHAGPSQIEMSATGIKLTGTCLFTAGTQIITEGAMTNITTGGAQ